MPKAYGRIAADQFVPVKNSIGLTCEEELEGLEREDEDDPGRRDDAEDGRQEEQRLDDSLGRRAVPGQGDGRRGHSIGVLL